MNIYDYHLADEMRARKHPMYPKMKYHDAGQYYESFDGTSVVAIIIQIAIILIIIYILYLLITNPKAIGFQGGSESLSDLSFLKTE
jgi:hypothetical protein